MWILLLLIEVCIFNLLGYTLKMSPWKLFFWDEHFWLDYEITKQVLEDGIGKAGGYALQNLGSRFVRKIRGCYTNVIGISIPELYKILKNPEL